jgi:lipopolysaccharide export LptBFGC system permease protein LptF
MIETAAYFLSMFLGGLASLVFLFWIISFLRLCFSKHP